MSRILLTLLFPDPVWPIVLMFAEQLQTIVITLDENTYTIMKSSGSVLKRSLGMML